MPSIDKALVLERVRERARRDLDVAVEAQRASARGVTHEESRAENDKDTRATEASYLARGQAARVEELRGLVAQLEAIDPTAGDAEAPLRAGSLVELEEDEVQSLYWLSPGGAGFDVEIDGARVRVVSTRSPLGRALLGRRVGDDLEVPTPRGRRELSITAVW